MKPLVFAHRGYSYRYPENTYLAFTMAQEAQADGIECDIQKTKDGHFVVSHDGDLNRLRGNSKVIRKSTWDELSKVPLAAGQKLLKLEEFLSIVKPGIHLDIELKGRSVRSVDCPGILRLLKNYRLTNPLVISSFNWSLLPFFRRRGISIGALVGWKHLWGALWYFFLLMLRIKPAFLVLSVFFARMVGKYLACQCFRFCRLVLKKSLIFWTVNRASEYELIKDQAFAVITDRVLLMREIIHGRTP